MQCINPLKAGFNSSGDIVYSSRKASKELVSFAFPCRKCLPCRLNGAREKAIRCFHEAQMHESNIFLTLTYDDDHLESPRLQYEHFQKFMKSLRDLVGYEPENKISVMVTGEYGEENKRPHWHALLFNFEPADKRPGGENERGDKYFVSDELDALWGRGMCNFGAVTLDSANYVARYAAKKLVHGNDKDHCFHPIHKTSSKNAIGRRWIEKNWKFTFENGFVVINGTKMKIPRYYVDWAKKHHPTVWEYYVTQTLPRIQHLAEAQARAEELSWWSQVFSRGSGAPLMLTRSKVKETILKSKFKRLQETLKL